MTALFTLDSFVIIAAFGLSLGFATFVFARVRVRADQAWRYGCVGPEGWQRMYRLQLLHVVGSAALVGLMLALTFVGQQFGNDLLLSALLTVLVSAYFALAALVHDRATAQLVKYRGLDWKEQVTASAARAAADRLKAAPAR